MPWTVPPSCPTIHEDAVHVWRTRIPASCDVSGPVEALLSAEERVRAERYRREQDRATFVVARAALRCILGAYLRVDPSAVQLGYSAHGKPYVVEEQGGGRLQFNLSHSGRWAVYAFALGRQVGVDVEEIKPMPDLLDVARRFFAEGEYRALQELTDAQLLESFFACWTRKEAYLKALGAGLSSSMRTFECTVDSAERPRLVADGENSAEVREWTFHTVDIGAGYAGTVVVEGKPGGVRLLEI